MPSASSRYIVLTGGPGAGKTTTLDLLKAAGYSGTVEAGRAIIKDQQAIDGPALPWRDPALFAEHMLAWEMRSHALAAGTAGVTFFDRGVPDVIGYLRLSGLPVPPHVERAAHVFRYSPRVFVFPPWRAIFGQDAERKQDFAEAERTFEAVRGAYLDLGYACVEVPPAPPPQRAAFILQSVGLNSAAI
ncbi:AAA family ATPase [Arvimicrobium flavum]|uniref:AAA family ATPase n=1 Tax=Arvimicrobium flavum TaxID=3393320 RepID=UPI00237C2227|nr:AAA family ATPase [Mesorhizobium shangrilense]